MKYYIISGEASGDIHGANLIYELLDLDKNACFRFWGGDLMSKATKHLPVKHYKDLSFMGFWEVFKNLFTILRNINFCKQDILDYQPDVLILIDYPGFNLRIAEFAKKNGFKVVYYISPQLWAWKSGRVNKIKKFVDKMLVILPFEKEFYAKFNYEVDYIGHPLLDELTKNNKPELLLESSVDKPIIAILPGSRMQEIRQMLPIMLSIIKHFSSYQFFVAGSPGRIREDYEELLIPDVKFIENNTYGLLAVAKAALVTSGTATLEAALFQVPEVVCYKGSWLSYQIGKRLVKNIEYISLVNLIMGEEVVQELIQNEFNTNNLKKALNSILQTDKRNLQLQKYIKLKEKLGGGGASRKAAKLINSFLSS